MVAMPAVVVALSVAPSFTPTDLRSADPELLERTSPLPIPPVPGLAYAAHIVGHDGHGGEPHADGLTVLGAGLRGIRRDGDDPRRAHGAMHDVSDRAASMNENLCTPWVRAWRALYLRLGVRALALRADGVSLLRALGNMRCLTPPVWLFPLLP